jgi:hypothetical protein
MTKRLFNNNIKSNSKRHTFFQGFLIGGLSCGLICGFLSTIPYFLLNKGTYEIISTIIQNFIFWGIILGLLTGAVMLIRKSFEEKTSLQKWSDRYLRFSKLLIIGWVIFSISIFIITTSYSPGDFWGNIRVSIFFGGIIGFFVGLAGQVLHLFLNNTKP